MGTREEILWYKLYGTVIEVLQICEKYPRYEDFVHKKRIVTTVLNKLKKIGEISEALPEQERQVCKQVAWDRILKLKEVDSGDAFGPDLSIIWEIIKHHLFDFARKISPRVVRKYQSSNTKYKKKMVSLNKVFLSLAKNFKKKKHYS